MLISEIANELARELNLRKQVFPKLITQGRLSQGESQERQERLEAALWLFRRVASAAPRMAVSDFANIVDRAVLNTVPVELPLNHIIKPCV